MTYVDNYDLKKEDAIMARRDGTGPLGQGSMTGRKLGNCNTNSGSTDSIAKNAQAGFGFRRRTFGQGRGQMQAGMGFGCRRGFGMGRQMGCGRQARRFNQN
jgi:hypothetical protein